MPKLLASIFTILLLFKNHPTLADTPLHELKLHTDSIDALCVKGHDIYTASFDGRVKRTDLTTSEEVGHHDDWVRAILCVDDNQVTASNDGRIIVWHEKSIVSQVKAHDWWVTDLAYHHDNLLVSVSLDETVKVWSYPDLKLLYQHKLPGSYKHYSVTILGNYAYVGSTVTLSVLDLKKLAWRFVNLSYGTYDIFCSVTTDNSHVYFGDSAGNIHQFDASTMKSHKIVRTEKFAIKAMTMSKEFLYFGNDSGHIYRVRVPTFGQPELIHEQKTAVRALTISDNMLYAASDEGKLDVYPLTN